MAQNCSDPTLLLYSGTSQSQRPLPALGSEYAQVDERSTADLILFAKKYGAFLNYYDATNTASGDWQDFMSNDPAYLIAGLADWKTKDFAPFIAHIDHLISIAASDADAQKYFKTFFDLVFTLAAHLDKCLLQLPEDIRFSRFLSVSISSNLALPLQALSTYYSQFKTGGLIDESSQYVDVLMPVDDIIFPPNFLIQSSAWVLPGPVTVPTITTAGTISEQILYISRHNLFTGALQQFLNGIISIVGKAPSYLEETLENYPSHSPHYALYLAFLRLFRFAQHHLNEYTERHLDFYYKEVLQLHNNVAEPDFVHLVFELQKNIDQHLLSEGTLFKSGKNGQNKDLFYTLTDDLVAQKAQVTALKSLFLPKNTDLILYASAVANSEDVAGAKLTSPDNSWYPFGNPKKIAPATIGFAIASNMFFLNEGHRTVTLTFQCLSLAGISVADLTGKMSMLFTGKKGWYDPLDFNVASTITCAITGLSSFSLSIIIPGNAPAIVPFSAKLHDGNFTEALPMAKVILKDFSSYALLKSLRIQSIQIKVGASVKNLSLQNDDGKLNSAKPFKPFGEFPEQDSSFIIGSKEIFQKPVSSLQIQLDWNPTPESGSTADTLLLVDGEWQSTSSTTVNLTQNLLQVQGLESMPPSEKDFSDNEDYKITSIGGFLKLQFNGASSISAYFDTIKASLSLTGVTLNKDAGGNVTGFTLNAPAVQSPPSPPVSKSAHIVYEAVANLNFNETTDTSFSKRSHFFYHIEPFGFREMHPFTTIDPLSFLPVFDLDDDNNKHDGGELWIGINNALPQETVSFLFQVADGSANPLKSSTTLSWFYLSNNNWLPFNHLDIQDQTNQLTRSGIVVASLPLDATLLHTRADTGLIWIKLVVRQNTDAVCKLVDVRANGAKAVFLQDLNADIEYNHPIAANTISKPAVADAALKKTEQPYPSFDGRVHETDPQFYVRVSERLRHKHRAITPWDYERLTLQYFPQIHKAKCIQHTGFILNEKTNVNKYSESLPGHVMLITVPEILNPITSNPLRPYTSIGLLTEIHDYLVHLTSPFVRLHVCNPQFEEVQFDFEVTFLPNHDIVFYSQLLNDEIEQFLTPWAFGSQKDIEFGGKIEKSVVLNFIEERSYVDFVTCFKLNHIISRDGTTVLQAKYDVEEAVASTARSILVSYYNEETQLKHIIQSPANCNCNA